MGDSDLQTLILDMDDTNSAKSKIEKILSTLRSHLGMNVAFISQFIDGQRVFRFVDTDDKNSPVRVGEGDPLEETYCKRIVDGELANIIPDAHKNDITNRLAVTDRLSIGSYMGAPITLSSGEVYGTFCCYKSLPDECLNDRDLSFLNAVAEIAAGLIESDIADELRHREITGRIQSVLDAKNVDIVYQPIYSLHQRRITGFESLSRFTAKPYRTPDIWFSEALQVGLGEQLEMMSVRQALKELDKFDDAIYLSVNVSPEYILSGAFSQALDEVDASRIVLEITEHTPIADYPGLRRAIEPLRKRGMRLAIDDAGAGYASFQHILELEAEIIKLDISLTRNIDQSPKKLLLARALCAYAKAIQCTVIAEGLETTEELRALRDIGVDMVQGYLLGRPVAISEATVYENKAFHSY